MATLTVPAHVPTPYEDAEQLKKAFDGWGTNEKLIISILAHRNAAQRKAIREVYTETYGEDLLKSLDKEVTSDFESLLVLWTLDPAQRDATLANRATKKWTASNQVLLEIACTRSSHDLFLARQAYHCLYKKSIEEDVAHHITGGLWQVFSITQLLVFLVASFRYEGPEVNTTLAKQEAKILRKHITDNACNHDEVLRIIATRSKTQLNATLSIYNNEFGNAINKDLKFDPKDEFLRALRSTIKCLTTPEKYFEKVLRLAINKTGTDEGALTRVVATRAEVDMKHIAGEYQRRSSIPLEKAIVNDTHGDYEDLLLALIGCENDA
ncbi:hypothetical protein MKW94_018579 [Papaver nudicaule]|uniref:Annexin n=1 Tax=Papaver nudicaule TaxID=74823 RepID=A0AA41SG39_PAPNU|nr:hypothetical protein [Papaver nudicaule]